MDDGIPAQVTNRPFAIFVDLNKTTGFVTGDWSKDHLHPSEYGFAKLAKGWYDALVQVLPNP